jgi:hypothetical protein
LLDLRVGLATLDITVFREDAVQLATIEELEG